MEGTLAECLRLGQTRTGAVLDLNLMDISGECMRGAKQGRPQCQPCCILVHTQLAQGVCNNVLVDSTPSQSSSVKSKVLKLKLGCGQSLHLPPLLTGPLSFLSLPRALESWGAPLCCTVDSLEILFPWHFTSWESEFIHGHPLQGWLSTISIIPPSQQPCQLSSSSPSPGSQLLQTLTPLSS